MATGGKAESKTSVDFEVFGKVQGILINLAN